MINGDFIRFRFCVYILQHFAKRKIDVKSDDQEASFLGFCEIL